METLVSRYQVLRNEDDSSETTPASQPSAEAAAASDPVAVTTVAEAPPPSYASLALGATAAPENPFSGDFPVPPPYSVATSLPTYDEVEKAKAAELAASSVDTIPRDEDFPAREDFSDADQLRVGNDGIFMLAFFMSFLFNWIGFCLSFCLTNTIAGRYGAICGFGLSLIKWILIFSDYFTGYFNGQYWLWWIFLVLGKYVFRHISTLLFNFSPSIYQRHPETPPTSQRWIVVWWKQICKPLQAVVIDVFLLSQYIFI
ncbi:NEDD4 family-interacting protein 2 isoform X2 [Trichomycterus rosablanca]|uniref:NEDD4 family-interacting protein 2 isoform X2 n=1 Tax=Trichomycterus rosablanca TaxID=2290929 RepID=UPI002F35FDE9